MPDILSILLTADYWLERYQTLLIGIAAIIAALWALRPAWRQVSIMEAQRIDEIRGAP